MKKICIAFLLCMLSSNIAYATSRSEHSKAGAMGGDSFQNIASSHDDDDDDDDDDDNGNSNGNGNPNNGIIEAHATITEYVGPATCISCHETEAHEALNSVHMQWKGPTPELTNTDGEWLGKAFQGINTFCTYAMTSQGACFSCHVRADGNAPHPPEVLDVDCLMCHSDVYQRKFVHDPENTETVVNVLGDTMTYVMEHLDVDGNFTTVPDYDKMPEGIDMVDVARNVHMPTRYTCLRCHASAGGGDWNKRGDMGWSTANPPVQEDVHLSPDGANLHCINCHSSLDHMIGGRGIDLRQTEAPDPTCQSCHSSKPHSSSVINRHAEGQVGCQVCHIRTFAKGGSTEMARDWQIPVWDPTFCSGQGGFVGEEVRASSVTPEYVWFDGTSYVYNLGEVIEPDENGIFHMAKANGAAFDGKSSIVPIKRHWSIMPLHDKSSQIVPPAIMWMFMTGRFEEAVTIGMTTEGMTGSYSIVEADAEMLITHGVDQKKKAPKCNECHDNSGHTPDGSGILPLTALGYHNLPESVKNCTLCHEEKRLSWEATHKVHREERIACTSCHTSEPTGLISRPGILCSSCHEKKSWEDESHKKHLEKGLVCVDCHTF